MDIWHLNIATISFRQDLLHLFLKHDWDTTSNRWPLGFKTYTYYGWTL